MKRFVWIAMLAAGAAGPAWSGSFDQNDTLKPDEGILLTSIDCSGSPAAGVQVFAEGTSSGGFFAPLKASSDILCRDKVATIRLKAGRYYVGQLFAAASNLAVPAEQAPHFNVEAGKLNYVGDLYVGQSSPPLDEETELRVLGRMLTALNHEPQMRERLQQPEHAWMARYAFVADKDLPPPVPVGLIPSHKDGQALVAVQFARSTWKRGADGRPLVCRRFVQLPERFKPAPGEPLRCDGDYIPPAQYVAEEYGPDATLHRVETYDGDDGALTLAVSAKTQAMPFGLPKLFRDSRPMETVRRQLEVPAGRWLNGRHGVGVCYDPATADVMDIASASDKECSANFVSTREYLRAKIGPNARFVSSATSGMGGGALLIAYDIDVPKQ